MSPENKFRVGIIGCGFISKAHMLGWSNIDETEIISICDIDMNKAKMRGREFGISSIYKDYNEMLEQENIDILDVITPAKAHKEIVISSSKKKLHVLCEKPFAENINDAKEMVKSCEQNKVHLMICQTNRWHPWFAAIKKELDKNTIGSPFYAVIKQRVSFAIPQGKNKVVALIKDQPFYKDVEKLVLLEQGCHFVDIFRFFFGEALNVTAKIRRVSSYVKGDDLAILIIQFPDLISLLEDSWVSTGSEETSVTLIEGDKGSIYFGGTAGAAPHRTKDVGGIVIRMQNGSSREIAVNALNYYDNAFEMVERHFLDCIKEDREPVTSGKDNLKTLEIVFGAYKSSELEKTIYI